MDKKKVLIVTQEMEPYTALSEISKIARRLPQFIQEEGMEIRVLMPRYGTINERRHRLHEVVRLSGMNIIVDDDDYPLIIKVASVPGARMQVYFLDNEDFFKRKSVFEDSNGKPFTDNPERMIFFCKGVIETVKKFGWPPDIVHCHGWMTSMLPLYFKTIYKNEPLFKNSKIVYSAYDNLVKDQVYGDDFVEKASINNLDAADLDAFQQDGQIDLNQGAMTYADAVVVGSNSLNGSIERAIGDSDKPMMPFTESEGLMPTTLAFYQGLLEQEVE